MDTGTMQSKRETAGFFSDLFKALAVLALCATCAATVIVGRISANLNVSPVRDPVTWVVALGGLMITLVLAGFGLSLGMLCVIYDRQESSSLQMRHLTKRVSDVVATPTGEVRRPRGVWQQIAERDETPKDEDARPPGRAIPEPVSTTPTRPRIPTPPTSPTPTPTPGVVEAPQKAGGGLWDWLTRERHLFKKGK